MNGRGQKHSKIMLSESSSFKKQHHHWRQDNQIIEGYRIDVILLFLLALLWSELCLLFCDVAVLSVQANLEQF